MKMVFRLLLVCVLTPVFANANNSDTAVVVTPIEQRAVLNSLGKALNYFDEIAVLPESTWFFRDKKRANSDVDSAIDDIIRLLDAPQLAKLKLDYRKLEKLIDEEKVEISKLKEARIFAPIEDATLLTRVTPTQTLKRLTANTRGDYDILIEHHEKNLQGYQENLTGLLLQKQSLFAAMGIELDAEQLEVWLSSVVGDDVLTMTIVFNSIKQVTQQLEILTNASGENIQSARRYYGMVVILHRLMLKMQHAFISKVDSDYLPKLDAFKKEANSLISESRGLLVRGGNAETLHSNIQSNQATIQAIDLYSAILRSQRNKVFEAMQRSEREYEVAENTYKTVSLSSQVLHLVKQGSNTFQALTKLQIPDSQPFQNTEMKEQFKKLSIRLAN